MRGWRIPVVSCELSTYWVGKPFTRQNLSGVGIGIGCSHAAGMVVILLLFICIVPIPYLIWTVLCNNLDQWHFFVLLGFRNNMNNNRTILSTKINKWTHILDSQNGTKHLYTVDKMHSSVQTSSILDKYNSGPWLWNTVLYSQIRD